jgi:DNA-directed RNA polymerase subunit RPC12/RpoP
MIECPKCGSRYLRPSQSRLNSDEKGWFKAPMRCLDCNNRFVASTLELSQFRFARCPKCHRMDLSTWSGQHFEPSFWGSVKLSFGGGRWRCEYCRLNFVSLRKRKEVFSFRRWERFQPRAEAMAKETAGSEKAGAAKSAQGSRHD